MGIFKKPGRQPVGLLPFEQPIAVRLTPEEKAWVDALARSKGVTRSAAIREIVAAAREQFYHRSKKAS